MSNFVDDVRSESNGFVVALAAVAAIGGFGAVSDVRAAAACLRTLALESERRAPGATLR